MSEYIENGKTIKPSGYTLNSVKIYPGNGDEDFNITQLVAKIHVTESIYRASIKVEISILDASGMYEKLKLSGHEKVTFEMSRNTPTGERQKYTNTVYVAEIKDYAKNKGASTYILSCVAEHAYVNQFMTLTKPFANTTSTLIENICTDDLGVTPFYINKDTQHSIKGVYTRFRPLFAINWLTRNSYDNGSPFYFYQTLKDGIIFDSYENMLLKDSKGLYKHSMFEKKVVGTEGQFNDELYKVLKLTANMSMSKYIQGSEGAYASQLHRLNVADKSYTVASYNYSDDTLKLNPNKPFEDVSFHDRRIEDYNEAKNHYMSYNTGAFDDEFDNYHAPTDATILQGEAYISNIDTMSIDLVTVGNFDISCGEKIEVEVINYIDGERSTYKDKILSGKYIITSIQHVFISPGTYTMNIKCKKDSFLDSMAEILEKE